MKIVVGFILVFIVIGLWGCGGFNFIFISFIVFNFLFFNNDIDLNVEFEEDFDGWVSGGMLVMMLDFLDDSLFDIVFVCSVVFIGF